MAWGGVVRAPRARLGRLRVGAFVAALLIVAVPLSSHASARTGIVGSTKIPKLMVKGFHSKLAISTQLASNWDATKSGSLAVGTFYNTCGGLVAVGTLTLKPIVSSDFDQDGKIDCYPQTQVQFVNVSTDGRGKNVAFQASQPFGAGITNPNLLNEVYLSTTKGIVQITGSWSANGWAAWGPAVSGDGKLVAFVGNGNPGGANDDGGPELFVYTVSSHSIVQLTNVDGGCTFPNSLAPQMSGNGNRIVFVSSCNFTGENPALQARPFVLDRHAVEDRSARRVYGLPAVRRGRPDRDQFRRRDDRERRHRQRQHAVQSGRASSRHAGERNRHCRHADRDFGQLAVDPRRARRGAVAVGER